MRCAAALGLGGRPISNGLRFRERRRAAGAHRAAVGAVLPRLAGGAARGPRARRARSGCCPRGRGPLLLPRRRRKGSRPRRRFGFRCRRCRRHRQRARQRRGGRARRPPRPPLPGERRTTTSGTLQTRGEKGRPRRRPGEEKKKQRQQQQRVQGRTTMGRSEASMRPTPPVMMARRRCRHLLLHRGLSSVALLPSLSLKEQPAADGEEEEDVPCWRDRADRKGVLKEVLSFLGWSLFLHPSPLVLGAARGKNRGGRRITFHQTKKLSLFQRPLFPFFLSLSLLLFNHHHTSSKEEEHQQPP